MNLAAFSPMITQGAIVLPVVTRGRIEPSAIPPGAFEIGDFPAQDEPFRGAI
jgi:hypothetical protein